MTNKSIEKSTKREISIANCILCGVVLGFLGLLPSAMLPADDFCSKVVESQECFITFNEVKEQAKIIPPITFGLGFFGTFLIQWLIPVKEQVKRTPI